MSIEYMKEKYKEEERQQTCLRMLLSQLFRKHDGDYEHDETDLVTGFTTKYPAFSI